MSEEYLSYYEYDKTISLNPEISLLEETLEFKALKVYYDSVNKQRVPSILVLPKIGKPKYPCLVFLHGYGGKKEDGLTLAQVVVKEGYAVFSIDAPYHGERKVSGKVFHSPDPNEAKKNFIQCVIDLRRGVDLLETFEEIDSNRIGYVGGSMGGIIGAIFVGVEKRIKAAVIMVGGGNLPLMIKLSKHHSVLPIKKKLKELGISYEELGKILAPVDPINFVHLVSPRPIQFHCGKYDEIVPAETQRQLCEKAREPKEIYWYDTGHGLPYNIVAVRALKFLNKYLKRVE